MASIRPAWPLHDEAFGIIIAGVGIFTLLSLVSWSQSASLPGMAVSPAANWGGVVGHRLASALVYAFGGGAFLLIGLLGQAACLWFTHAAQQLRLLTGIGGVVLLLGVEPLLQLTLARPLAFMGQAGGQVGCYLVALLVPYCNVGGSLLIAAVVATLGGLAVAPPLLPVLGRGVAPLERLGGTLRAAIQAQFARWRVQHRWPQVMPELPTAAVVVSMSGVEAALRPVDAAASAASNVRMLAPEAACPSTPESVPTAGYQKPSLTLLNLPTNGRRHGDGIDLVQQARLLASKLHDFGVDGRVVQVLPGPVVTMYEFEPASGVKVSRIVNLADDLALGMKALSVRIVAPVPGKSVVGIEIPNPHREPVVLREILASPAFQQAASKLVLALGKDILGAPTVTDLAQIPHLLIAGATGSGKSVGLNSMICSILLNASPDEVKFIMIDPKMLELSVYDGIPHLIAPVVTHPKKAAAALHWAVQEMERRYRLLAEQGVRGIDGYNQTHHPAQRLPYIVVVIDELADLMLVARRDVEDSLTRLAQMARAAGLHLLVATQRPSVDVLTGIIKANFPARISFQVSSRTDSRTILDAIGAERLLGKGDMLFLPPGTSKLMRIHGAFVSEAEIKRLVASLQAQPAPIHDPSIFSVKTDDPTEPEPCDDKYDEAVALVSKLGHASASLMQRHLRIGYNRAARLLEAMEREGVVGPADGSRPREVYIKEILAPDPLHR